MEEFSCEFTKRNELRATRLEVVGEIGAQEQEEYLPLGGVSFESKGTAAGSVEIVLGGETAKDPRPVEHLVTKVHRIAPLIGQRFLINSTLEETDATPISVVVNWTADLKR